nr:MAG TPA: hypothetical protein [Caudoviricetes sp.]
MGSPSLSCRGLVPPDTTNYSPRATLSQDLGT